jgi:hypothetical protein
MSPKLLYALDKFRELCGKPVYVSPAEGATWRPLSSSYHSCLPERNKQSWAIDVFPTCTPWEAFISALSVPEINGIGLYPLWRYKDLDFGMHIDIRNTKRVIWVEKIHKQYDTIHSFSDLGGLI